MSIISPFLCFVAIVLNSPVLFQNTTAALDDRDRAILAFNPDTDPCAPLNAFSDRGERTAADWACVEAFLALDRINGNYCYGWRDAGCRFFHDTLANQCSCTISICNSDITNDVTKSFRDCALQLLTDEFYNGPVRPSFRSQETFNRVESSVAQAAPERASNKSLNAGSSGRGRNSFAPYTVSKGSTTAGWSARQDTLGSGPSSAITREAVESYNASKPHVCGKCGKRYGTTVTLGQHMKSHLTQSTICTFCNKPFSTTSSCLLHMRTQHKPKPSSAPGAFNGSVTKGTGGKIFMCDICGHEYDSTRGLSDHKKTHTEDIQCQICKRVFLAKGNFDTHVKNVHPGFEAAARGTSSVIDPAAEEAYKASRPYVCGTCGNRYVTKDSLNQHIKSHTTQDATCTICNRTYSTPYSYRCHMKSTHEIIIPPGSSNRKKT